MKQGRWDQVPVFINWSSTSPLGRRCALVLLFGCWIVRNQLRSVNHFERDLLYPPRTLLELAQNNLKDLVEKYAVPSRGLEQVDNFEFSLIICLLAVRSL
jgi:hypothetical protein